jgi:glycosyltransferase involved in cell wall biosynthesis
MIKSTRPKVLFIYLSKSSFVEEDLKILSGFSDISEFQFTPSKSIISLFYNYIRQFLWLLQNIWKADAFYCWFSDYHSILPILFSKLFKKPFITVLGGFDCNKLQKLNYGIFCSSWRAPLGTYTLKNSSLLLPVDEHLISTNERSKFWEESHPNGVTHNVKNFSTPWKALPTGYSTDLWKQGDLKREKIVSTVCLVSNHVTAQIKGLDIFIDVARLLPDFQFQIVGCSESFIPELKKKYNPPKNISLLPPRPRDQLSEIYQKTSVYLQLSRAEGFPNVLCEAMISGCIPIGSPVFGIPNVIGNAGYVAEKPDPQLIATLLKEAHQSKPELREKARTQIIDSFPLEKRARNLQKLVLDQIHQS